MRAQFLYNLFHIPQLLWREEGVIQQPVITFSILVFGTKQVDRSIQELQHPMASFDTFGMVFDTAV